MCWYLTEAYGHPASLHIWGSACQLVQHPKKDVTTRAVSSPMPWVRPTKTVSVSWRRGVGGHFTSLHRLVDCVQLFRFSVVLGITCTSSHVHMPPSSCAKKHGPA